MKDYSRAHIDGAEDLFGFIKKNFKFYEAKEIEYVGVKKVAELQYEPKTLSALCVQQIHSVEAVNDDPRIVLSATIDDNQNFADILHQLKK